MNDEASAQTFNKLVVVVRNTRERSVHRVGSGEYEVKRPWTDHVHGLFCGFTSKRYGM